MSGSIPMNTMSMMITPSSKIPAITATTTTTTTTKATTTATSTTAKTATLPSIIGNNSNFYINSSSLQQQQQQQRTINLLCKFCKSVLGEIEKAFLPCIEEDGISICFISKLQTIKCQPLLVKKDNGKRKKMNLVCVHCENVVGCLLRKRSIGLISNLCVSPEKTLIQLVLPVSSISISGNGNTINNMTSNGSGGNIISTQTFKKSNLVQDYLGPSMKLLEARRSSMSVNNQTVTNSNSGFINGGSNDSLSNTNNQKQFFPQFISDESFSDSDNIVTNGNEIIKQGTVDNKNGINGASSTSSSGGSSSNSGIWSSSKQKTADPDRYQMTITGHPNNNNIDNNNNNRHHRHQEVGGVIGRRVLRQSDVISQQPRYGSILNDDDDSMDGNIDMHDVSKNNFLSSIDGPNKVGRSSLKEWHQQSFTDNGNSEEERRLLDEVMMRGHEDVIQEFFNVSYSPEVTEENSNEDDIMLQHRRNINVSGSRLQASTPMDRNCHGKMESPPFFLKDGQKNCHHGLLLESLNEDTDVSAVNMAGDWKEMMDNSSKKRIGVIGNSRVSSSSGNKNSHSNNENFVEKNLTNNVNNGSNNNKKKKNDCGGILGHCSNFEEGYYNCWLRRMNLEAVAKQYNLKNMEQFKVVTDQQLTKCGLSSTDELKAIRFLSRN